MTCLSCTLVPHMPGLVTLWPWSTFNQWHLPDVACQASNQCFMSVHVEVILDTKHTHAHTRAHTQNYTSLPTGLWTINLTIELIISVLYKISLMLSQVLKTYPFFLNNSVVIGHSSSMCLTDRIFLQKRLSHSVNI